MTRAHFLILSLAGGLGLGGSAVTAADVAVPANAQRIEKLLQQLDSPRFAEREAASKQLDAIGAPALPALKRAAAIDEPEMRRRAEELIARIESRLQIDKLLQPTRVRLVCKNLPLSEAVAELARKSGHTIVLAGDPARFRDRTVTLDTGDTTFWQALDKLCRQAGLADDDQDVNLQVERAPRVRGNLLQPLPPRLVTEPGAIGLKEGKSPDLPMDHSGAARVRVMPAATAVPGSPKGEGEILFVLDASLEPRAVLEHATGTRIAKAVDDQGQELRHVLPADPAAPFGEPVFIAQHNGLARALLGTAAQQVAVRLQPGDKPARSIKELKGWVTAEVRTPPEPLLEIGDILQAADKTVKGPQGASVTVTEIEKLDEGQVTVRVDVQPATANANKLFTAVPRWRGAPPAVALPDGLLAQIQQGGGSGAIIAPAGGVIPDPIGFTLVDDKGRSFQLVSVPRRRYATVNGVVTHDLTLHFKPHEGQGQPAKLVYSTMRVVTVDIPFTLRDIPIP